MRRGMVVLSVALVAAFAFVPGTAVADGCNGEVTALETPAGTIYVDQRSDDPTDADTWIYLESNAVPGLQSGGESLTGLYDDPCAHEIPDTLIF